MLDSRMRAMLGPALGAAGRRLARAGVAPAALTGAGWAAGAGACAATALRAWPVALGLWLANRLLDGPTARAGTPTDTGGFLDIVADFSVYAGIILGLAIAIPGARLACAALLAAYYISGTAFLALSSLAERRRQRLGDERSYAFVVFSRSFNTAGSVYGFNASALGPGYGFVSAWLLLLVYTSFAAGVYAATADIAQTLLASLGVHAGWVWLGLAGAALALALAYTSIGFSSLVILAAEGLAVALITVVGIAMLVAGGYHHHGLTAAPFTPHGVSVPVLALGVTAAFGQFSGFESPATLGEEARAATPPPPGR